MDCYNVIVQMKDHTRRLLALRGQEPNWGSDTRGCLTQYQKQGSDEHFDR